MHLVRTTDIVPIDLNALLFGLEQAVARGAAWAGRDDIAQAFEGKAVSRRRAIGRWLWNEKLGLFDDLSFSSQQPRGRFRLQPSCRCSWGSLRRARRRPLPVW